MAGPSAAESSTGPASTAAASTASPVAPSTSTSAEQKLTQSDVNFRGSTISVFVGGLDEPFILHRDLMATTSRFFQQHPPNELVVELSDVRPALFELYAEWQYGGRRKEVLRALRAHETIPRPDGSGLSDQPGADNLCNLYLLGARLRDATFRNAVVDAFVEMLVAGGICPTHLARSIYEGLPRESGFARLYVDMWCWNSDESWFEELEERDEPNSGPVEFWVDVAKRKTQLGRKVYDARIRAPWVANRTQYHEPEDELEAVGEPRASTRTQEGDYDSITMKMEPEA